MAKNLKYATVIFLNPIFVTLKVIRFLAVQLGHNCFGCFTTIAVLNWSHKLHWPATLFRFNTLVVGG